MKNVTWKSIGLVLCGIIIGLSVILFYLKNDPVAKTNNIENEETINDILHKEYLKQNTCNLEAVKREFENYYKFYIDNSDFYVIPESIQINELATCTFQVKFIRQSRDFKDIQHTNYVELTFNGDKVNFKPLQ